MMESTEGGHGNLICSQVGQKLQGTWGHTPCGRHVKEGGLVELN